jgi:flavin-dependent dehydrogenase
MWDVLIAGAGPAGTVAATILARAGARVLIVDRERFPRNKLCGDSISPGTIAVLRRLNLADPLDCQGLPIDGMLVTGPLGARVHGRYPRALQGRTVKRYDLDQWLLRAAVRSGAQFEDGVVVRRPLTESTGAEDVRVTGAVVGRPGHRDAALRARVTIAADGRRSALSFALGLAHHPARPRRWAVGGYFHGVNGTSSFGEMHVRAGEYVGLAPLGDGLTNVCLVAPRASLTNMRDPDRTLRAAIDRDENLRERFAAACPAVPPVVLGPLALDVRAAGVRGLLLAGDAAGFIDPITGDGLWFAVRGAELAAEAALEALATDDPNGHLRLAQRRRDAFAWKWRLNRAVRRIVDSRTALSAGVLTSFLAPALVRSLVAIAGGCHSVRVDESARAQEVGGQSR